MTQLETQEFKIMDLIKKEFNHTLFNVMTPTSRNGNIRRTLIVEEETEMANVFKCRVIKSDSWFCPGSSYNGQPKYDNNEFEIFTKNEILGI